MKALTVLLVTGPSSRTRSTAPQFASPRTRRVRRLSAGSTGRAASAATGRVRRHARIRRPSTAPTGSRSAPPTPSPQPARSPSTRRRTRRSPAARPAIGVTATNRSAQLVADSPSGPRSQPTAAGRQLQPQPGADHAMTRTRSTSRSRSPAIGHVQLRRLRGLMCRVHGHGKGETPMTRLVLLVAATVVLSVAGGGATAAATDAPVGHTVKPMVVPGSTQSEPRKVDVHLWYPADSQDFSARTKAVYTSALYGQELIPERWDPLSWKVEAELAREDAAIDPHGQPFPAIVFSHGSVNDPINYAHMLERIAGAGFVVAAPSHVTDTQEDVRIDYINAAGRHAPVQLQRRTDAARSRYCRPSTGTVPGPATRVPQRMADRARDISKVLDELPGWFGARADMSRKWASSGHSRGTLSGLAAAGGSTAWGFPDARAAREGRHGHGQRRHVARHAPTRPRRHPNPDAAGRRWA